MSAEPQSPAPAPSWMRLLTIALIVSLSVNLLLIGVQVSYLWRSDALFGPRGGAGAAGQMEPGKNAGRGHREPPRGGAVFGLRGPLSPHTLAEIAPDKADTIRHIMATHHDTLKNLKQASMTARQDAIKSLADDRYTKESFARALDRVRSADTTLETEILSIVAQSADTLGPEQRKAILKYPMDAMGGGRGPGPGCTCTPGRGKDAADGRGPDGRGPNGRGHGRDGFGRGSGRGRDW